ncbi:MAG: hypothetical protein EpisKO_38860 [Epibacterium sp.]
MRTRQETAGATLKMGFYVSSEGTLWLRGSGSEQSMAGMPQSQFNPPKSRECDPAGFAYKSQESYGTLSSNTFRI